MKPILILQHLHNDGPGYLGTWLSRLGVPVDLRNTAAGQAFPADLSGHAAMAILGGAMSANDDLPALRQAEVLIRDAIERAVPVLGHCLGGQLMARALGGRVVPSPDAEIGWQPLQVLDDPGARDWFGSAGPATVFQWHYEAFVPPPGATRLAGSDACPNQAFGIGPHLAMQFHIEIDAAKARAWAEEGETGHLERVGRCPSVQAPEAIIAGIASKLPDHQRLADRIYGTWSGAWKR